MLNATVFPLDIVKILHLSTLRQTRAHPHLRMGRRPHQAASYRRPLEPVQYPAAPGTSDHLAYSLDLISVLALHTLPTVVRARGPPVEL